MIVRSKKPEPNNKFYNTKANNGYSTCINGSPSDKDCNVLANCVGYACGRFNEIIGKMAYPSLNCNAENFIERAQKLGLKVSMVPTLGGIMVWQKGNSLSGSDGAGHVAIVERIDNDKQIYTSESAYGSKAFYNVLRNNTNGRWGQKEGYIFRGCIINPAIISSEFKVGDLVVPIKLVNYNGKHLKQYDEYYIIKEIKNDRVVLSAKRKEKMVIWAAMNINNIKLYKKVKKN